MARSERVTVTLAIELIEGIDHFERNRSRFIAEAVEHELVRRRRKELLRSLKNPHSEAAELAETGLAAWGQVFLLATRGSSTKRLANRCAGSRVEAGRRSRRECRPWHHRPRRARPDRRSRAAWRSPVHRRE
jgi:hypothetical protein